MLQLKQRLEVLTDQIKALLQIAFNRIGSLTALQTGTQTSLVSALNWVLGVMVRIDITQTLTTAQLVRALTNLGIPTRYVAFTEVSTGDIHTNLQTILTASAGKRVVLGPGAYTGIGQLLVPANTELELQQGAILTARELTAAEKSQQATDAYTWAVVKLASGARLSGRGVLDGNRSVRTGRQTSSSPVTFEKAPTVLAIAASDVYIEKIKIQNTGGKGIYLHACTDCIVDSVRVENGDMQGIDIVISSRIIVTKVRVSGTAHGIQIWGDDVNGFCEHITITGCQVRSVVGGGIWANRTRYTTITGNNVQGCDDVGIDLEGSRDTVVSSNTVRNCKNGGLTVFYASKRIEFLGNMVYQEAGMGPAFRAFGTGVCEDILISGGILMNDDNTALQLDYGISRRVRVKGVSICSGSTTLAPVLLGESNYTSLEGCYIRGKAPSGIRVEGGLYTTLKNNELYYEGSAPNTAFGIYLFWRTATYSAQCARVVGNTLYNYNAGIKDDCWGDNTSCAVIEGNQTPAIVIPTGAGYGGKIRGNFTSTGALIDGSDGVVCRTIAFIRADTAGNPPYQIQLFDPGREGIFNLDLTDTTSADNAGTILVTAAGKRYKRAHTGIIQARWFGGSWDGNNDDSGAVNAAIAYARTLSSPWGGAFRPVVQLPAGQANFRTTINATGLNGITIKGAGSRGYGTSVTLNTSATDGSGAGIGIDFTNSHFASLEDMMLMIDPAWGNIHSKIGVQFALGQDGSGNQQNGLKGSLRNVVIQTTESKPTLNGGLGIIGVVNVRSGEFSAHNVHVSANLPFLFSNHYNLAGMGYSGVSISSPYATVITNTAGSMGVMDFSGQCSLLSLDRYQPAIYLNGANGLRFHGYMSRSLVSAGTNQYAVITTQANYNHQISGTVENFSTVIRATSTVEGMRINVVLVNCNAPTSPILDLTGAVTCSSWEVTVTLPNTAERASRYLLYHADNAGGDEPCLTSILNSVISCPHITDNNYAGSRALLKKANNVRFNTAQPFERTDGGVVRSLFTNKVSLGTHQTANNAQATVMRFRRADRVTTTSGNGGYYRILLEGVLKAGTYGSGGTASSFLRAEFFLDQNAWSGQGALTKTVSYGPGGSTTNAGYLNVGGMDVTLTLTTTEGILKVIPLTNGSGVGEPITFQGRVEIQTDFYVNDVIPYT